MAIEIEPASRRARQGETVQFTATVTGSDETAVTWSATGGEISAEGLFTAPEVPGVSTVVATAVADPTKSASATVEVPVATGLSYADPATEGWRLVKNVGASTPDRLVLDLVGPEGESGRGVELVLATEPAESVWAQVDPDTDRVRNIAFDLGPEPRLLAAHEAGGTLRAGVFQKGDSAPPAAYTGPLVSVALELASGATVASGTPLVLGVERASELPGVGSLRPVHVEIGALAAE